MVGEKVILRPMERADLPAVLKWWNDPEVMCYADDDPHPHKTLHELSERYEKETGEWAGFIERFVIETNDRKPIGDIMYRIYNKGAASVYLGIIIGEKEYWGRGCGTEAVRLFLKYLFDQKGFHKVALTTSDLNLRAIRAFEKCGFRRDGVLRHNAMVDGRYVDHIVVSMLEDEFRQLYWRSQSGHQ